MSKGKFLLFIGLAVLILSIMTILTYQEHPAQNKNKIITIARKHLEKYVHNAFPRVDFFSMVKKIEVEEGECEANGYWQNFGQEKFCGFSTYAKCRVDSDCQKGGCSGEVCGGKKERIVTPCLYKECYDNFGYSCKCVDNKCQWVLSKYQCWIVKFYYPGPSQDSFVAVYVDKRTNKVIGGTQTR